MELAGTNNGVKLNCSGMPRHAPVWLPINSGIDRWKEMKNGGAWLPELLQTVAGFFKQTEKSIPGRPEVQNFVGELHGNRAKKGVLITTGRFSDDALKYGETIDSKVILGRSRPCRAYTTTSPRTGNSAALHCQPVMRSVRLRKN